MKLKIITLFFVLGLYTLNGQLNNAGSVVVSDGAILYSEGDICNFSGSELTINGTVALRGNYINQGTVVSDDDGTVQFMGTKSSIMLPGVGNYSILSIEKAGDSLGTSDVIMLGELLIDKTLDFTNGLNTRIILGNNKLSIDSVATVLGVAATKYVVTNGTGVMEQKLSTSTAGYPTAIIHPVGDIKNYSPISSNLTGTTLQNSSTLSVNVQAVKDTNLLMQSTDYIKRHWNVKAANVTSYNNAMTGTYAAEPDMVGNFINMVGSFDDSTGEWFFTDGASTANSVTAKTTLLDTDFTGQNFYGKVRAKVLLDGPYNDVTGKMNNTLYTKNLIPTTSPYNSSVSVNTQFLTDNSNIVDWVEIEAKTTEPSLTSHKTSCFILTDGNILTVEGILGVAYVKDANPNAYILIHHRNHLSVATSTMVDLRTAPTVNFTDKNFGTYGIHAQRLRTNWATMWAGDANGNTTIAYQGVDNDDVVVSNAVRNNPSNFLGLRTFTFDAYHNADLNMDGTVKYQGANNDATSVLYNTIIAHPNNFLSLRTFTFSQNIPQ